jgi:hypothetical protein
VTTPSAAFLPESVQHHWQPQFRPNSLPTPATTSIREAEPAVQNASLHLREPASFAFKTTRDVRTTQQNQSHILPNFPSSGSLDPKRGYATTTRVPTTHSTIRAHSYIQQPFVIFSPEDTTQEKAIVTQQALLLQILRSIRLLSTRLLNTKGRIATLTMPYADRSTQCAFETPTGRSSTAQQRTRSAMPGARAETPEDPWSVFNDYRQHQTSRYKHYFSEVAACSLTYRHIEECHYCQHRQLSDAECLDLLVIRLRAVSAPANQSGSTELTSSPQPYYSRQISEHDSDSSGTSHTLLTPSSEDEEEDYSDMPDQVFAPVPSNVSVSNSSDTSQTLYTPSPSSSEDDSDTPDLVSPSSPSNIRTEDPTPSNSSEMHAPIMAHGIPNDPFLTNSSPERLVHAWPEIVNILQEHLTNAWAEFWAESTAAFANTPYEFDYAMSFVEFLEHSHQNMAGMPVARAQNDTRNHNESNSTLPSEQSVMSSTSPSEVVAPAFVQQTQLHDYQSIPPGSDCTDSNYNYSGDDEDERSSCDDDDDESGSCDDE